MPRSRSRSLLSITRSATFSLARNTPLWRSRPSTSVVLPWSTWAMMATLRQERVGNRRRRFPVRRHPTSIAARRVRSGDRAHPDGPRADYPRRSARLPRRRMPHTTDVFVARQPIFDDRQRVFAYELLFRSGPENYFTPGPVAGAPDVARHQQRDVHRAGDADRQQAGLRQLLARCPRGRPGVRAAARRRS